MHSFPAISVTDTLTAASGVIDLWCHFYDERGDDELEAAQRALITADELTRWSRLRFEDDRRMFLATRALVRCTLSEYFAVAPADWRFSTGPHGKPYIQAPVTTPALHFNLANTKGLVVCAVSVAHELVGVDVERTDRTNDTFALAERFFSPSEACALTQLPSSAQLRRFYQYWTLKESYLKANGWGLTAPLARCSFSVSDDGRRIGFDAPLEEEANLWRFAVFDASPHHMLAVAAKTEGHDLSLRATGIDSPFART
jgi:4'-phosphopantetheinyl transferase